MRRNVVLLAVLFLALPLTAEFKKPYFAGTVPGTWAKYEASDTHNGHTYTMTYRRMPDEGDHFIVEIQADFPETKETPAMSSVTRYEVASTFGWDKNAITFPRYSKSIAAGVVGGELTEIPGEAIAMVTKEAADYGKSAKFNESTTVDGRKVDHYTYEFKAPSGSVESGELWVNPDTPFGIVRQTSTMKDAEGKLVAKMVYVLKDSGTQ